jgi:hypothetical protein
MSKITRSRRARCSLAALHRRGNEPAERGALVNSLKARCMKFGYRPGTDVFAACNADDGSGRRELSDEIWRKSRDLQRSRPLRLTIAIRLSPTRHAPFAPTSP